MLCKLIVEHKITIKNEEIFHDFWFSSLSCRNNYYGKEQRRINLHGKKIITKLGMRIKEEKENKFLAQRLFLGKLPWGEKIEITFPKENEITIKSKFPEFIQCFDLREKNKKM